MELKQLKYVLSALICLSLNACGDGGGDSAQEESLENDKISVMERACGAIGLPVRVINGESCGNIASSSVVRVVAEVSTPSGLQKVPMCTASLILPDIILTAAHCFKQEMGGYPVVGYGVHVGEVDNGTYIPVMAGSIPNSFHANHQVDRLFDDAMLMLLASPLNNPLMPLLMSRAPQIGEPGYVYGYGARDAGNSTEGRDFTTLEAGAMHIANVTQNHIFVVFDGEGTNVCNGDSGGPIVVLANGQPALAGITSQGNVPGCMAGDITTFTNIHSPGVLNWLKSTVPDVYLRNGSQSVNLDNFVAIDELLGE